MRSLAALVFALLAAPAGATDGLPEVLQLGPNSSVTGQAMLRGGVEYRFSVSGTMARGLAPGTSASRTETVDAFYCFASTQAQGCGSPEPFPSIYVRSSGDPPGSFTQLASFFRPRVLEPPFASDHVYAANFVPASDGEVTFSTTQACAAQSASCSGPGFEIGLEDVCGAPTARIAAVNEVRVVAVAQPAAHRKAGTDETDWRDTCADTVLQQGDEISLGPGGSMTLQFADNSTVVVTDTTQLKIASFFTEGGVVRTEILLRMGQVAAKVHKSEAARSDFVIKTGSGHKGSVRGTSFTAFYDPGTRVSLWSVREGVVAVTGAGAAKEARVSAGREVEVTAAGVGRVAPIGKAGARGGNNRRTALQRVSAVVMAAATPCGVATPRTNAYAIRPARGGWRVALRVEGKLDGTSTWTVKRKRVSAKNALAKQLRRRCA